MNFSEALSLYQNTPLAELMAAAHELRLVLPTHKAPLVTWQIDRNINTTNVCVGSCRFCSFHCRLADRGARYVTSMDEYRQKIAETITLGGDQILLQGGMNPEMGIDYYERLFASLRSEFPSVKLHALGPAEVVFLAKRARITTRAALERLVAAGMSSLPGAGAEILDNEWRRVNSPGKCSADEWIEVMRQAHAMGLLSSATMMYGFRDTAELRIKHLMALRELQSETGGFRAFIAWPYRGEGTAVDVSEYLRMIATARLMLDNIPNIQASWLTMGTRAAQMALHGGANDVGSIMIEENVVRSAGCDNRTSAEQLCRTIAEAGFTPALRDQAYNLIKN